jgi:type VI protein secretion system component Hcp
MSLAPPIRASTPSTLFLTFSDPSVAPGYPSGIPIASISFGPSDPTRPGSTDRASGPGRITITRIIDRASPLLARAQTRGPIGDLKLTTPDETIVLTNVVVTHIVQSQAGESPKEEVTFEYGSLQVRYTPQLTNGSGPAMLPTPTKSP